MRRGDTYRYISLQINCNYFHHKYLTIETRGANNRRKSLIHNDFAEFNADHTFH